jgi:hypothetical protein
MTVGDREAREPAGSGDTGSVDQQDEPSMLETILRQLVAVRAASAVDDELALLVRMVDSATWSAPVPMTILVDGAVLRGILVPSEVSAAFLDNALLRSARAAVDQYPEENAEASAGGSDDPDEIAAADTLASRQARAFLQRVRRRPFSAAQSQIRRRNASALRALGGLNTDNRSESTRLAPLDIRGSYRDPQSPARDVIPYTVGQRALTLAEAKMLAGGEWLALPAPVRVSVGRIGAWTVDL